MLNIVTSMSSKRELTAEEIRMAARIKAAIAAIPGMTEERVGAELGISQGAVSHWTGGRLPVPAKRAAPLAALLGITEPRSISLAYRQITDTPSAAPQTSSQPMRFDPDKLALAHRVLRDLYHESGRAFSLEADPVRFLQVYEIRESMSDQPTPEEWIQYGRKLAAIMAPQGVDPDGRGDGVPVKGTGAGKMARGVRRKA